MLVSALHVVCTSIIPLRKTASKLLIFEITGVISKPRWGKIILKNMNTEQFFVSMMLNKKKNGNRKILNRSHCQKNSCWEGSFEGGPLWHFFEQLTITSWPKLNWFYGNSFVFYLTIFPWSCAGYPFCFYTAQCHIKVSLMDDYPNNNLQSFQNIY